LRAGAVDFCGCEIIDDDENNNVFDEATKTCNLCPDGSTDVQQDMSVSKADFHCKDITTMTAVDGEQTCEVLSQYSYVCGCPAVQSSCTLCEEGHTLANPSNLIISTDFSKTELLSDTTCADYDKVFSTIVPRNSANNEGCRERVLDSQNAIGFDVMSFCGCSSSSSSIVSSPSKPLATSTTEEQPPYTCNPCPEGMQPKQNDLDTVSETMMTSCRVWLDLVTFITKEEQCLAFRERATADCCIPVIPPPQDDEGDVVAIPNDEIIAAVVSNIEDTSSAAAFSSQTLAFTTTCLLFLIVLFKQ